MEKVLGISYYKHNNQIVKISLYDKIDGKEYTGALKLSENITPLNFRAFSRDNNLLIPISDSMFDKFLNMIILMEFNRDLNEFLIRHGLLEWII
jgi:hypothetical protein